MLARLLGPAALAACLASGAAGADRPVVVELFTSEGCSSCPPADAYLTELTREGPSLLPLAFHVTYWNGLGWRDPYSLEVATERQRVYGARFGDGSYTPELVVDGRKGVVGSDRGEAAAAIAAAGRQARNAAPVSLARQESGVSIDIGGGGGAGQVLLIGFDHQHRTAVGRGENGGRTLTESNIVRSISVVGRWTGAPLQLDRPSPAGEEAAVIVQGGDGVILGAARLDPAS